MYRIARQQHVVLWQNMNLERTSEGSLRTDVQNVKKYSCHMGPQTKQFDYDASCSGFLHVSSLGL